MGCANSKSKSKPKKEELPEIKARDPSKIEPNSNEMVIKDSHFPGGIRTVPKLKELDDNPMMVRRKSSKEASGSRSGSKESNSPKDDHAVLNEPPMPSINQADSGLRAGSKR